MPGLRLRNGMRRRRLTGIHARSRHHRHWRLSRQCVRTAAVAVRAAYRDPPDATYPEMPQNALATVEVHHCLKLAAIAPALIAHASGSPAAPVFSGPRPARVLIVENDRVLATRLVNRVRELGYVVAGSVA